MSLDDLARFLSPKKPSNTIQLLRCFQYGKTRTKAELLEESRLSPSMLHYEMWKLTKWSILFAQPKSHPRRYYLSRDAFHTKIDAVLVDPLQILLAK